jgi:hypothetical protein
MERAHAIAALDSVVRSYRGFPGVTLALIVAVLLAGCPGATSDVGTVTPAPVPTPPTTESGPSAESSVQTCGAPTPDPLDGDGPPRSPAVPAAIPTENATVNASALLARHEDRLAGLSYRLDTPGYSVAAAPNGSAYRVGAGTSVTPVRHYVVGDRRYTFTRRLGGRNIYELHHQDGLAFRDAFGDTVSLTGRLWLAEAMAVAPHRVSTRRSDGWAVLRADVGNHTESGNRTVSVLNSTVLVDRRGVVRSVDQRLIVAGNGTNRMIVQHFAVTDLGNTSVRPPSWLCDAVRDGPRDPG